MQIIQIKPKIIVTLGRHAFSFFFPHADARSARGKFMSLENLNIFPIYHPAAALYNPKLKTVLQQDFQKISAFIQNYPKQEESAKTTSNTTKNTIPKKLFLPRTSLKLPMITPFKLFIFWLINASGLAL